MSKLFFFSGLVQYRFVFEKETDFSVRDLFLDSVDHKLKLDIH